MPGSKHNGLARWISVFLAVAAVICLPATLDATTFTQFVKMDIDGQAEYVAVMVNSVQMALRNAGHSDQAAQIEQLFTTIEPGDATSVGLVELERNLALARVYAAKDAEKDPKAKPIEVEDALFVTLEKNKIPMTETVMNAVMDSMANFHPQTFAEFMAKSPAEQRQFIALMAKLAWPDYEFRDSVQKKVAHEDTTFNKPGIGKDILRVIDTQFPIQSSDQPGFAEFAKKVESEYEKSPRHGVFTNLTIYILEEADALTVKVIANSYDTSIVLPDGRHVLPDNSGDFRVVSREPQPPGQEEPRLDANYQQLAKLLYDCKERRGIANGDEALEACRNEPDVRAAAIAVPASRPVAPPLGRTAEPSSESKPSAVTPADPGDDPIGQGGFITPPDQPAEAPIVVDAPATMDALVCVPAILVERKSFDNPQSGGKMEAFRNAAYKAVRDRARDVNIDDRTQFVITDKFDEYDPDTTDSRSLVTAKEGVTSGCPADNRSYILKVEVKR